MKVAIAGNQFAVELVDKVIPLLKTKGITTENLGATSKTERIKLKEIISAVAEKVKNKEVDFGILACGTGVGVEIGANRLKGIRASLCRDDEQTKNARVYDDANLLCLGSWYNDDFEKILEAWTSNKFNESADSAQLIKDFDS